MSGKTHKNVVYACLALAIIWGIYNLDFNHTVAPEEQVQTTGTEVKKQQETETVSLKAIEDKKSLDWGQDPFRTSFVPQRSRAVGQWVVSGILYNKTSPLAYINAQPVKVGDTVDNARVIDIEKDFVTLEYRGNKQKIYVLEG